MMGGPLKPRAAARTRASGARAVALAALLGPLAGCATAGGAQAAPADAVVGCYQFQWTDDAAALGLPWGFELLAAPLEGWGNLPDGREARTRTTEHVVRDHPFAYWRPVAADTIRVGHPGGGGFSLTLHPDGPDLVGTARSVGDAVAPGQDPGPRAARPVVAWRVLCPPPETSGAGRSPLGRGPVQP